MLTLKCTVLEESPVSATDDDGKAKTKGNIQWLPRTSAVPVEVRVSHDLLLSSTRLGDVPRPLVDVTNGLARRCVCTDICSKARSLQMQNGRRI